MAERRSSDTREKILEVAERAFARDGFAGAHLQHIAEQVGVQKTALYYYFPSKAALYEAVLVRMIERFHEILCEALDRDDSLEQRLERMLDAINDVLAEHRNYSQILIRIFVDRVDFAGEELRPRVEAVLEKLIGFFKEGKEAGVFVHQSTRHLAQTAIGALVFHYATGDFGAQILGVDDIFTSSAVAWRRGEMRRLGLRAILADPPAE